jgi:leucyl-tRNA synthetase
VAPDTIVGRYGADTLRLYILNVAPPEDPLEWNDDNIAGVHRFLHRVWRLLERHAPAIASEIRTPMPADLDPAARALRRRVHQTIQKVSADIEERFKFNTAVSALIELEHAVAEAEPALAQGPSRPVFREALETLVLLLSPFAPHVCEEMWMRLGRRFPLVDRNWPVADAIAARSRRWSWRSRSTGSCGAASRCRPIPRRTRSAPARSETRRSARAWRAARS